MIKNYKTAIIREFKYNNIRKVLVVDDAFDRPPLKKEVLGNLLEFMETEGFREKVHLDVLSDELYNITHEKLNSGDIDIFDEDIIAVYDVLYDIYSSGIRISDELESHFSNSLQSNMLEDIIPILELMNSCGDNIEVKTTNFESVEQIFEEFSPQLVFWDYYMKPVGHVPIDKLEEFEKRNINKSTDLLKKLCTNKKNSDVFIILMSSKQIIEKVKPYIQKLDNSIMAIRFGVILKKWIRKTNGELLVDPSAGQVLLDSIFGTKLNNWLEQAINCWKNGVEQAVTQLEKYLMKLDRQDFSYLIKYRLNKEGEVLSDYLEWFFGEALRTLIDNHVNWKDKSFEELDKIELNKAIIGVHSEPKGAITQLYHNTRISGQKNHRRKRFGLGDLFVCENEQKIRMVLTPDCDLISRKKSESPKAVRLLTVGGNILEFTEKGKAVAEELIMFKSGSNIIPKSIKWEFQDVCTHIYNNENNDFIKMDDGDTYNYYGTLRPLFAQSVQKEALSKFSRVGVAVAPTVYVEAHVDTYFRNKNGKMEKIEEIPNSEVTIIMARGGSEKFHTVIFDTFFVYELIERLNGLTDEKVGKEDLNKIEVLTGKKEFIRKLTEGIVIDDKMFPIAIEINTNNKNVLLKFQINIEEKIYEK